MKKLVVFLVVIFALCSLGSRQQPSSSGASTGGTYAAASPRSGCNITKDNYDKLLPGMGPNQVAHILGCAGQEISRSDIAGYRTVMYQWYASNSLGGNMNATFQNDRMVSRAQFGLR